MPAAAAAAAAAASESFGISLMVASVMRMRAATEAADSKAVRVTLTGSDTPMEIRSPYSPVAQFRPSPLARPFTFSTTTEPS